MGHVAFMGNMRSAYKTLVRKPMEKRLVEKLRHEWEDNIKLILEKYDVRL
jgi:hypothetical protein